jgi:predicted Zn-dependent protease
MKPTTTYFIAAGVFVLVIAATATLWSNHKIASLERDVEKARSLAAEKAAAADDAEKRSAESKAKNDYLQQQIAELKAIATKQDEELTKLSKNTDDARGNVDRARRTRTVAATADQLCAKLAQLGHPCE